MGTLNMCVCVCVCVCVYWGGIEKYSSGKFSGILQKPNVKMSSMMYIHIYISTETGSCRIVQSANGTIKRWWKDTFWKRE